MPGPNGLTRALDRGAVDALLYAGSALFAAYGLHSSTHVDYRTWATFAWPAYTAGAAGGAVLLGCAARLGRRQIMRARVALAAAVLGGALVAPLAAEIARRAQGQSKFVASEVIITESAAAEFLAARDPFTLVTALATGTALSLWRAHPSARLLALQVLVALPTGAALLVIGGDDVAVLALCLLGLVLAQGGRHAASLAPRRPPRRSS